MIVKNYSTNVEWCVGSLFAHDDFVLKVDKICKEYGEVHKIKYVYGSIPCVLTGGVIPPRTATIDNAKELIDEYNSSDISCRLAFTKKNVLDEDMKDGIVTSLLSHLEKNNSDSVHNGVIVSDDNLARYIRDSYRIEIISSSISTLLNDKEESLDYYNSLFDIYDIVRIYPRCFLFNRNIFDNLTYPDRVEFSVNNRDFLNRNLMKSYYNAIDDVCYKYAKGLDFKNDLDRVESIISDINKGKRERPLAGYTLSYHDILWLYSKGIKRFCLEGRDFSGVSFVRDLGDYVFNYNYFLNIASSILEGVV